MSNAGPLTKDDFLAIWISATDPSYHEPFLRAGEGEGLEVHTQMMAQYARVSEAVDVTTQALFIKEWSGQTNPPAGGSRLAVVNLTFSRTKLLNKLLVLKKGQTFVSEETVDMDENGGVPVLTGRKYVLDEDAIFFPGSMGPITVRALAERAGYGYNNPLPGTISSIDQPGSDLANDHASVFYPSSFPVDAVANALVIATNVPDMFAPENVGQYLYFVNGANAGRMGRVYEFINPNLSNPVQTAGSQVRLPVEYVVEGPVVGTFLPGETLQFMAPGSSIVIAQGVAPSGVPMLALFLQNMDPSAVVSGALITGLSSGATMTVSSVIQDGSFIDDPSPSLGVGGSGWKFLSWVNDWGLTCTNTEKPSLGRAPFLDAIGWGERGIARAPGEPDESYRARISDVGDVVAPNAIKRAVAKVLGSIPWCFKEVGTDKFPGFFFDGDGSPPSITPHGAVNDAYDTTVIKIEVLPGTAATFDALAKLNNRMAIYDSDGYLIVSGWFGRVDTVNNIVRMIARSKPRPGAVPAQVSIHFDYAPNPDFYPVISVSIPPSWDLKTEHVWLDYEHFRGFFKVCTPPLGFGESGQGYDVGPHNAYDAAPYDFFYDGQPYGNVPIYKRLRQAIDEVKAGGVVFELCEDETCTTPNG